MRVLNRLIIYILGIFFIALGGVIAIKSKLGVSPISSLPFSINRVTGISIGVASVVLFCIYVLIQIILLKKDYKKIQLLQIVFAVVFGKAVDLLNNTINLQVNNFGIKIILCLLSVIIIAVGIVMTLKADIVPLAPEGLAKAISTKFNIEFGKVKMRLDCVVVSTAVIVLLVGGKNLEGVGIGTIISAVMVGKCVQIINRAMARKQTSDINKDNEIDINIDDEEFEFREA